MIPSLQDALYPGVSPEEAQAMALEEAAWQQLHPELVKSHSGQSVAIFQGQPAAHDSSFAALFRRTSKSFPGQFVWLEKVRRVPAPIRRFRSPCFVDQVNEDGVD